MTAWPEVSTLSDRELDARIDTARAIEHPALSALLQERLRRTKAKLHIQDLFANDPDRTTRRDAFGSLNNGWGIDTL